MIRCPVCGNRANSFLTSYGIRNSHCGLWSWGDGAPLVDAATHEARKAAHAAFDPLWKVHGLTRSKAYSALAEELGIKKKECHMKSMDWELARKVPPAVESILRRLDFQVIE